MHSLWKTGCATLSLLLIASQAWSFQVCWDNPTENVDGTVLTDLTGLRLYYGTSSRQYDLTRDVIPTGPGLQQCSNFKVAVGTWFVAMTAFDSDGNESGFSNEVLKNEARGLPDVEGGRLETPTGGRIIRDG